jgi:hypothetical protein
VAVRSAPPLGRAPPLGLAVPPDGPGTCVRCHGPVRGALAECWCCRQVGSQLATVDVGPQVVPVALCRPGDELHSALRRYKDGPAVTARRHFADRLARMLSAFLEEHGPCLRGAVGTWEQIAVVPSSRRGRDAGACPSPFSAVVAGVAALATLPRVPLGRGSSVAGHLQPAVDAFVVSGPVAGRKVLLVDDTWVTGARARSAAAALTAAGASVVAVLVIGRCIDPSVSPHRARWWEAQRTATMSRVGRCCLAGCRAR